MAVQRYDDLDGTEGAETVHFALDGQAYEIDLSGTNAQAFRAMFGPYLSKARPAQEANGVILYLPASLDRTTGLLTIADQAAPAAPAVATADGGFLFPGSRVTRPPLQLAPQTPEVPPAPQAKETPAPAEPTPPADAPAQPSNASATEVRTWANRWSVPGVPSRGRMPTSIRDVYDSFHSGDREPWETLLREHGIDPPKAEAKARALTAVDSNKQTPPTQQERDRKAAERVGKLSSAQLTRLRRMYAAPDGRAVSDRKNGDTTSFEALAHRGCCVLIDADESDHTSTYEITNVGRLWFDVRGIDPVGS